MQFGLITDYNRSNSEVNDKTLQVFCTICIDLVEVDILPVAATNLFKHNFFFLPRIQ